MKRPRGRAEISRIGRGLVGGLRSVWLFCELLRLHWGTYRIAIVTNLAPPRDLEPTLNLQQVNAMLDQVIAWGGALKALREK